MPFPFIGAGVVVAAALSAINAYKENTSAGDEVEKDLEKFKDLDSSAKTEVLRTLVSSGYSQKKIAEALNITPSAVSQRLKKAPPMESGVIDKFLSQGPVSAEIAYENNLLGERVVRRIPPQEDSMPNNQVSQLHDEINKLIKLREMDISTNQISKMLTDEDIEISEDDVKSFFKIIDAFKL